MHKTHHTPPASKLAGQVAVAILAAVFALHAYWGAGGTWGAATAFGTPDIPPSAASVAVAVLIACAAALLLARLGVLATPLPPWMLRAGTWLLVVVFALNAVNNFIQPQDSYAREWHMYLIAPLLLLLAVLCAVANRSKTSAASSER